MMCGSEKLILIKILKPDKILDLYKHFPQIFFSVLSKIHWSLFVSK